MSNVEEQKIAEGIGRNVKLHRVERRLSQRALAAKLGVTNATVSNMETGKRHVSAVFLVKVAYHLGVHPGVLFIIDEPAMRAPDLLASTAQSLRH